MTNTVQDILPGQADQQGWRRLHPITPLLRGWKAIVAILVAFGHQSFSMINDLQKGLRQGSPHVALIAAVVIAGLLLLLGAALYISWRMTKYRLTSDLVQFHSGVLFRQQKQAKLDRLQAVDIVRPLAGRIFGLSELRIEVAGGQGSDFRLSYLTEEDANRLRQILLAGSAGVEFAEDTGPHDAPERPIFNLPGDRLLISTLISGTMIGVLIYLVGAIIALFAFVLDGDARGGMDAGAIFGFVIPSLGVFAALWSTFSKRFNFEVADSPDGIRLRHGLVEHRSQTVPPGRIQAIEISQPVLWRFKGWWNIQMNVAGYGHGRGEDSKETTASVLAAVVTFEDMLRIIPLVFPDLGHPEPVAVLRAGMLGDALDPDSRRLGFVNAPRRARWLDFIGWRRHGILVTDTALLLRRGIVYRRLTLVPHARMQSVGVDQGPVQRKLGVASFVLHSTPGPVRPRIEHLELNDAHELLRGQVDRSAAARAAAGPEKWMRRAE